MPRNSTNNGHNDDNRHHRGPGHPRHKSIDNLDGIEYAQKLRDYTILITDRAANKQNAGKKLAIDLLTSFEKREMKSVFEKLFNKREIPGTRHNRPSV
jgi:hypothetical protein